MIHGGNNLLGLLFLEISDYSYLFCKRWEVFEIKGFFSFFKRCIICCSEVLCISIYMCIYFSKEAKMHKSKIFFLMQDQYFKEKCWSINGILSYLEKKWNTLEYYSRYLAACVFWAKFYHSIFMKYVLDFKSDISICSKKTAQKYIWM